jgi:hypothetical protein
MQRRILSMIELSPRINHATSWGLGNLSKSGHKHDEVHVAAGLHFGASIHGNAG